MWHRFGRGFDEIILRAAERSEQASPCDLSTGHLLWALTAERDLPAAQILDALGVAPEAVQERLAQSTPLEAASRAALPTLTLEARNALEAAYHLAAELDDQYVGGEHLLLAFLQEPDGSDAGRLLAQADVTFHQAGQALLAQQKWRTEALTGVPAPGLASRRLLKSLRGRAGNLKRLAYGFSHYKQPFMPYLIFRKRSTDDPYPFYTRLRCRPAYWDPLIGHWIVTRYEDVVAALAETRLSQRIYSAPACRHENLPPIIAREFRSLQSRLDRQMLFQDAPDQSRQRALVAKRFTPRVIAQMQAQMEQVAGELLGGLEAAGQMEFIADVAVPFPLLVIARMLGLPTEDLSRFKKWSNDYFKYLTFETTLADDLAASRSVQEAEAYFRALLPQRRLEDGDDLVTRLLEADEQGEFLPEDEVVANCLLLLATGHENTTRLLSSGLLALIRHPQQWRNLCEDPSLVPSAVEELLRFDSPVQWTMRYLAEDLEWQGHALKKGQRVQIGIGPANRDPKLFPEADRLDITRTPNRHLAFGHGPHFCLGAALTRLEAQTMFRCLITRFPHLALQKSPEWRQEGLAFRGLQSLPIRWDAAGREN